jgi:hypothetical protein
VAQLEALGAEPVVCGVFDAAALTEAVVAFAAFAPEAVVHQLTDLPDTIAELAQRAATNDRMRGEGTRNLIAAADWAVPDIAQTIRFRS